MKSGHLAIGSSGDWILHVTTDVITDLINLKSKALKSPNRPITKSPDPQ
jgi:hypothetical protein